MEKSENIMDRRSITKMLSLSLEKHLGYNLAPQGYIAKEVTFDHGTSHAIRVDYMRFKPLNNTASGIEKGDFYCYEVKSSVEDFRSKNGHNFIGDYNYYVMPEDVYESVKNDIPYYVGVYVPGVACNHRWYTLESVKKAKRHDRSRPVSEMLLMMFRSCVRGGFLSENKEILEMEHRHCKEKDICIDDWNGGIIYEDN